MKAWVPLALMLSACQDGASSADEAIAAGNAYLAQAWPQQRLNNRSIEVTEEPDRWRVAYVPPYDSTGWDIVIYVDKRTGRASEPPLHPNANLGLPVPPPS